MQPQNTIFNGWASIRKRAKIMDNLGVKCPKCQVELEKTKEPREPQLKSWIFSIFRSVNLAIAK
jgi:hypothetical protein